MKTKHIFSIAALAICLAACNSEDNNQLTANNNTIQTMPFKATIQSKTATRGLTESNGEITAQWEEGEQVVLAHGENIDVMKVTEVDKAGNATIEGTISNASDGEEVHVMYVGSDPGKNIDLFVEWWNKSLLPEDLLMGYAKDLINGKNHQEGTLDYIDKKLDLRYASTSFTIKNKYATFRGEVNPTSLLTVLKVTLQDADGKAYKTKYLDIKDKDNEKITSVELPDDRTYNVFYVALPADKKATYNFESHIDKDTTYCTKADVTLESGMYYTTTLKMISNKYMAYDPTEKVYISQAIPDDAINVESGTTSWGKNMETTLTYVVNKDVTIDGDVTLAGSVNLILRDGATLNVNGKISGLINSVLTIYGQANSSGKLNVTKEGDNGLSIGKLIVHGGDITVKGEYSGIIYVDICVHGGKVKASGTNGDGYYNQYSKDKPVLEITGGTFEAEGAIGIRSYESNIAVSGGTLIAKGRKGEGIYVKNITVSGNAEVTATSSSSGDNGISFVGELTISGGKVKATGGKPTEVVNGCGIYSSNGTISMTGGELTAIGGGEDAYAFGLIADNPSEGIKIKFPAGMTMYNGSTDPMGVHASGAYENAAPTLHHVVIK